MRTQLNVPKTFGPKTNRALNVTVRELRQCEVMSLESEYRQTKCHEILVTTMSFDPAEIPRAFDRTVENGSAARKSRTKSAPVVSVT